MMLKNGLAHPKSYSTIFSSPRSPPPYDFGPSHRGWDCPAVIWIAGFQRSNCRKRVVDSWNQTCWSFWMNSPRKRFAHSFDNDACDSWGWNPSCKWCTPWPRSRRPIFDPFAWQARPEMTKTVLDDFRLILMEIGRFRLTFVIANHYVSFRVKLVHLRPNGNLMSQNSLVWVEIEHLVSKQVILSQVSL